MANFMPSKTVSEEKLKCKRLWVAASVFLVAVFVFSGLTNTPERLFRGPPGNKIGKFYLPVTPAGWTFSIWGFIYTWQALWVLYSLVLLCRSTDYGPVYMSPVVLSPTMVLLYMLANACNIAWLLLFDREKIEASLVVLTSLALSLIICLTLSYRTVDAALTTFHSQSRQLDIWLLRIFLLNGLGIYAAWTSIATVFNLGLVIAYSFNLRTSIDTAGTVTLGVLLVEIVVFVLTDLCLLDRLSRYTITPYLVVVVALSGSMARNWQAGAINSVLTAVLLAVGVVSLLCKVAVSFVNIRHVTKSPSTCDSSECTGMP